MAVLTLFHAVGACSEVTLCALRHTGLAHEVEVIDLAKGEQRKPAYLAINPNGKVPALLDGGRLLVENPAIILYLDRRAPETALLPHPDDPFEQARIVSDLVWCSSTLHPLARAMYNPMRLTTGDTGGIRDKAARSLHPLARLCEERYARERYWHGADWTIIDRYIAWLFGLAAAGGLALDDFPRLASMVASNGGGNA